MEPAPQYMYHLRCPVHAIRRILLPSQVNQRAPPFHASSRISSPLVASQRAPLPSTASQRAPLPLTASQRTPLPMNILLFSQTSQLLPFLWVSEGHLKFLWPRTLLPKTQPALQVDPFWWNWQIQTPWPPSSTYHPFAQEETASEASQPVLFMPIPLLQLSPTLRHPVPPVLTLQEPV